MAADKNGDLIEAMLTPRPRVRAVAQADAQEAPPEAEPRRSERRMVGTPPSPAAVADVEGRIEVRPIGTRIGFAELAALHKKTWSNLNVREKQVHALLWPLALHFGLYVIRPGEERRRPRLIAAFWARCLADSPLTLGHLYPPQLFKDLRATDVWEFGGMVVEPTLQHRGLMRTLTDTARLFLFSRRPRLMITNPVEPLYELYRQFGMKTIGSAPVEHPHADNVKVWLMYGKFEELSKPYFM